MSSLPPGDRHGGYLDRRRGREVLPCRLTDLLLGARGHVVERRVVAANCASGGGDRRHGPATERRRFGCAHAGLPSFEVWSLPQGRPYAPSSTAREPRFVGKPGRGVVSG